MKRAAVLALAFAAAACGGRESPDVDAAPNDASYDLDAHWGECCDRTKGGLGRPCTGNELDGGNVEQVQCPANTYCGLYLDTTGLNPPDVECCGDRGDPPIPGYSGVDESCPPWPQAVEASWGDCCYQAEPHGPDAGLIPAGGAIGPCPKDATYPHVQCSQNQYCGLGPSDGSTPYQQCCGDHSQDQGTINASGLDPNCMPEYWQL